MTLPTSLKHVETETELKELIGNTENVMVCCGRMGPMCVPVYGTMEDLQNSGDYDQIEFRDMAFDSPESQYIRSLPECQGFRGLPFTVYFKNGAVAAATSSVQTKDQITAIIDEKLAQ
jgi:thioredoxin 1